MVPIVKTGPTKFRITNFYTEFGPEIWPHSVFGRFKMVNGSDHDLEAHIKNKK